jgi:hypothetical protein
LNWLIRHIFTARPARPVFAEDIHVERAMRIAELKWLLADIAGPVESGPVWPA